MRHIVRPLCRFFFSPTHPRLHYFFDACCHSPLSLAHQVFCQVVLDLLPHPQVHDVFRVCCIPPLSHYLLTSVRTIMRTRTRMHLHAHRQAHIKMSCPDPTFCFFLCQGCVESLFILGDILLEGGGIPPDQAKGFNMMRRAADAGHTQA